MFLIVEGNVQDLLGADWLSARDAHLSYRRANPKLSINMDVWSKFDLTNIAVIEGETPDWEGVPEEVVKVLRQHEDVWKSPQFKKCIIVEHSVYTYHNRPVAFKPRRLSPSKQDFIEA